MVADDKFSDTWILDSGCSFQMCPHREYFDIYKEYDASTIRICDDFVSKVMGIGTVKVKMYDGAMRILTNVRQVPKLRRGLISLRVLDTLECDVSAKNNTMNIARGASVVMKGKKVRNLYMLIREPVIGGAMKVEQRNGKFFYAVKEWVKVKDHNKTLVQIEESKELVNKNEVATTSYVKIEEINNKKHEVMEQKKNSVCRFKFDESLNFMHIYSC